MWLVEADLTPFYDRWGTEHYRLIYKSKFKLAALFQAWIHCKRHPYGSASVIRIDKIIKSLRKDKKENMNLIIDEKRKAVVENLIDPTSMKTIAHYLENNIEGITFVMIIQEGYDLAEVASPFIVPVNNVKDSSELLSPENQVEYMKTLLKEGVTRMIVPEKAKKHISEEIAQFVDVPSDYNERDAYLVALTPPIYWATPMNKQWE